MTKYITVKLTEDQYWFVVNTLSDPEATMYTAFVGRLLTKLAKAKTKS